jgi:predicted amidohydrolase YtcJ
MSIRLAALIAVLLAALAGAARAQPADAILTGGRVVTLDEAGTVADALAVRDGRILAVGGSAAIEALAGPATRRIALAGRTVIPGLIDSHIHAIRAGLRFGVETSWIGAQNLAEALDRIRRAAAERGPDDWIIVAGGWAPHQFAERRAPTQAELEAAAPGRKVYVQLFYGAALMTRAAMAALDIRSDAALPNGGTLERGAGGRPTGWVRGRFPAITALYARLPRPTLAQSVDGTRRFFRELNRFGLTGVIDPGGYNLAPAEYEALFALHRAEGLSLRVVYSLCAPTPGSEPADLQRLAATHAARKQDAWLRFNGIGERVTWAMNNNPAPSAAQKDEFVRIGIWAARQGLSLTMHWNEDASIRHLLEAFERIDRAAPIAGLRWSIAHIHDATPATLNRMKRLGIGWLTQNRLYFARASYILKPGARMAETPPLGHALRIRLPTAAGTDAHRVMGYNPFVALRWMIDGLTVEGLETRGPAERPSREQALRLYTQGGAWFARDETARGALRPGMLADLAVLNADIMRVPTRRIADIESLLTMAGGRIVYAAGPYAALR